MKKLILFFFIGFNFSLLSQNVKGPLEFKYFGTAGFEISDGEKTILIDPYISRIKLGESSIKLPSGNKTSDTNIKDKRRSFKRTDIFESDTTLIKKIIQKADFIFIHHSHFDHLADVPFIARLTGAKIIGTETTVSILEAYGIKKDKLYTVKGGEDYQFDGFSVRVIPGIHSALADKHYFSSETYKSGDVVAPLRINQFIEGGSLMFMLMINNQKVLTMGSMNFIESEIEDLNPDILLAGVNLSRFNMYKYDERLLTVTGFPRVVIPTHWDNFRMPYSFSQEVSIKNKLVPFRKKVTEVSPKTKVIFPIHLQKFIVE